MAQSSKLEFENFSQKIGELHGQINEIAEDDLGYLWFGTANGLYKYDGYTLEAFHHDAYDSTSISSRGVIDLEIDRKGRVWTSSIMGINLYERTTNTFRRYFPYGQRGEAKRQNIVRDLFVDADNVLWMAGHHTLVRFDEKPRQSFTEIRQRWRTRCKTDNSRDHASS